MFYEAISGRRALAGATATREGVVTVAMNMVTGATGVVTGVTGVVTRAMGVVTGATSVAIGIMGVAIRIVGVVPVAVGAVTPATVSETPVGWATSILPHLQVLQSCIRSGCKHHAHMHWVVAAAENSRRKESCTGHTWMGGLPGVSTCCARAGYKGLLSPSSLSANKC